MEGQIKKVSVQKKIQEIKNLPYLTADEAAILYRVSEITIRRWGYTGVIESVKIGGAVRYPNQLYNNYNPQKKEVENELPN